MGDSVAAEGISVYKQGNLKAGEPGTRHTDGSKFYERELTKYRKEAGYSAVTACGPLSAERD